MSDFFVHDKALCECALPGAGSRILAFACVARDARMGRDCLIGNHSSLGSGVVLGHRVTVQSGAHLGTNVRVDDDVHVGANATFVDCGPPDLAHPAAATVVRSGAAIGANATILAGVSIGPKAKVAAGAVVTRSVPPNAIVAGNPAQIVGYVDAIGPDRDNRTAPTSGVRTTPVKGVTLHQMREVEDLRGNLSVGELGRDVPFDVKRYFLVYDVPNMEIRGEHAHLTCHQFLIAVKGSVHVVADDGLNRTEILLDRPSLGLHLPPLTWGIQYRYSLDAVLLVLASHHYDATDYVRDHDQFVALVAARAKA